MITYFTLEFEDQRHKSWIKNLAALMEHATKFIHVYSFLSAFQQQHWLLGMCNLLLLDFLYAFLFYLCNACEPSRGLLSFLTLQIVNRQLIKLVWLLDRYPTSEGTECKGRDSTCMLLFWMKKNIVLPAVNRRSYDHPNGQPSIFPFMRSFCLYLIKEWRKIWIQTRHFR